MARALVVVCLCVTPHHSQSSCCVVFPSPRCSWIPSHGKRAGLLAPPLKIATLGSLPVWCRHGVPLELRLRWGRPRTSVHKRLRPGSALQAPGPEALSCTPSGLEVPSALRAWHGGSDRSLCALVPSRPRAQRSFLAPHSGLEVPSGQGVLRARWALRAWPEEHSCDKQLA